MFEKCGKLQFSLKTSIQEHLLHVVWSSFVDVKEAINFILMREASFRLAAQLNLETEINRQTETSLWISPLSGHKACSDDCKISVASSVCTSTNTHCFVPLRFFYGHTECQMEILRILQKNGMCHTSRRRTHKKRTLIVLFFLFHLLAQDNILLTLKNTNLSLRTADVS